MSEAEVAARFQSRLKTLQVACGKYSNSSDFRPIKRKNYRINAFPPVWNHKLTYCPIQKTSSTTSTGIVRGMLDKIRKDYDQAKSGQGTKVSQPSQEKPDEVRFTFVREPYGRLLSAYVDKIFSPNTVFWRTHGRYIVEHFRPNASNISLTCGHDVTFPEFVQFFIHMQTTGMKRDGHFFPTHDHCQMCNRPPFHYIGHLETLKEDMPFILKAVHSPVSYNKTFENITISGNINMVIRRMRNKVRECMGLDEACRRLWKKWQIRGIISKTIPFPLTKEETRDISAQHFQDVALSALGRSGEKSARTPQKREALMEAFASVSLEDRLKVKRLPFLDFQMFGFSSDPEEVFPSGPSNEAEGGFRYFDLYK